MKIQIRLAFVPYSLSAWSVHDWYNFCNRSAVLYTEAESLLVMLAAKRQSWTSVLELGKEGIQGQELKF